MANKHAPFHPIIYVRGYAMSLAEIDQTTADPFCGFNLGSTTYRATPDKSKPARKFIFESPVVRLGSDFGYCDVYEDGLDIVDPEWTESIAVRSIVIYRYYDEASRLLGAGRTPEIEHFAQGLSAIILKVRELVCKDPKNDVSAADFRCYLVAHSMGGLICRAFLQNPKLGDDAARRCVDKVFTYATPHNGIEMAGTNVPSWLSANDINNFSRSRMAKYLNVETLFANTKRVDWLPERYFPTEKFFCMIGTNRTDYEVANGISRTFAGHGSDGLVKIDNASVWGVDGRGQTYRPCATAYAYRSHSGCFGIVHSEESYQNLIRFLFGDVRVDIWVDVEQLRLPADVQKEADAGKKVGGLYQFELLASPRGKRWYLTRRTPEEDSVACRRHEDLVPRPGKPAPTLYLSTVFLGNTWKVNKRLPSLAYGMTLGIRVPDYEIDRVFWPNKHYEGSYLFRDSAVIEMVPPRSEGEAWKVTAAWQSSQLGQPGTPVDQTALKSGKLEIHVPFERSTTPGIGGKLRFIASAWNV